MFRTRGARRRCTLAVLTATVVLATMATTATTVATTAGAVAVSPAVESAADRAVAWLVTQQQPDGGFEVAGFPGFETSDAVFAIADAAQTTPVWSTAEARAAVEALHAGGPGGPTPLDALDVWVAGGISAGDAAKLILLVVVPLGLDPHDVGTSHTDLAAMVYPTGCSGSADLGAATFYGSLTMGLAGDLLCGSPDPTDVTRIRAAQRSDGSWSYTGDPAEPTDNGDEVDVTSIATQVLVAAGATVADPAVRRALAYLASQQYPSGAFDAFGQPDPNSTAMAMLAVAAVGFDPASSCWRDTVAPERSGAGYTDPTIWLLTQQLPDGRVQSPNDGYGVNTYPTSQTVEGWLQREVPVVRAGGAPDCAPVPVPVPVPDPDPDPRFTG